jgi:uncharacterized membrane protein
MRGRLLHAWEATRSSLWFVPTLMACAAVMLALLLLWLDARLPAEWSSDISWIHSRTRAGARDVLSTIASSMMTVAGLAFSITVVALQLASTQFGPRLLRNFMADRSNQAVLGTFIATYLYCILVLRTIGGAAGDDGETPRLAVSVAVLLAVVNLGVLIYFIHHAAASMQAPNVIAGVRRDLEESLDAAYEEEVGEPPESLATTPAAVLRAPTSGYIQRIDYGSMARVAGGSDLCLRVVQRPGAFVLAGDTLAHTSKPAHAEEFEKQFRKAVIIGSARTPEQDPTFAIDQLTEIALRALSPSMNDPFTAINCIEHLAGALVRVVARELPPARVERISGRARVVAPLLTGAELVRAAFTPIRQQAAASIPVCEALIAALSGLGSRARAASVRATILEELALFETDLAGTPSADLPRLLERISAARTLVAST